MDRRRGWATLLSLRRVAVALGGIVTVVLASNQQKAAVPAFSSSSPARDHSAELATASILTQSNPRRKLFWTDKCAGYMDETKYKPKFIADDIHEATEICSGCVAKEGCFWCPMTQTCTKSASRCPVRSAEDQPVSGKDDPDNDGCKTRPATWIRFMEDAYGDGWENEKDKHIDAVRCSQWALGWEIDEDPLFAKKKESGKVVGLWACQSAMLRAGILRYLKGTYRSIEDKLDQPTASFSADSWDMTAVVPKLCEVIRLSPDFSKTTKCEVDLFGIEEFAELRKLASQPNAATIYDDLTEQIVKSIEAGPVVPFSPGAGKSGSGFARTDDNQFKIKLGVKDSSFMAEPANLLTLVKGNGKEQLKSHLEKHPESLLNRYYGLLRTNLNGKLSNTLVMQDASYLQDEKISNLMGSDKALQYTRYDLKGKSRDQNTKQKPDKTFCLINGDFKQNENNKLELSSRQCWHLRKAVRADAAFLKTHNMIDYSLYVGIAEREGGGVPTCKSTPGEPFCFEGARTEFQYTFSIIDYLNNLNSLKMMESVVHLGKFASYDKKINDFVNEICYSNEIFEETRNRNILLISTVGGGLCIIFGVIACFTVKRTPQRRMVAGAGPRRRPMGPPGGPHQQQGHHPSTQMTALRGEVAYGSGTVPISTEVSHYPGLALGSHYTSTSTAQQFAPSPSYTGGSAYPGGPRGWGAQGLLDAPGRNF